MLCEILLKRIGRIPHEREVKKWQRKRSEEESISLILKI